MQEGDIAMRVFTSGYRNKDHHWNKPDTPFHRTVNWVIRHVPLSRRVVIKVDDMLGYGKPKPEWKWWLDLEEVDGVLRVALPPKSRS